MRILYEIGLAITSGLGLDNTVRALYNQLKKIIPVDFFYLALISRKEDFISFHAFDDQGKKLEIPPLSLTEQPSLTRYTIEKGRTVYIPDVHAPDAEYPYEQTVKTPGDHDEKTHLGIPLIQGGNVLGALAVRANPVDAYATDQIRLVETIANQASVAMDNARMFEEVQHLAVTDSLTGLYNRRYFFPYAENEIERARRYQKRLSIIMMDIDHFKKVNDRFGHMAGDRALKMVAQTCLAELRKVDVMCRFGGEEFLILLPETSKSKAALAARRIRDAVASARILVDDGEIALTVSIGVAELDENHSDLDALIQAADKALYQAKEAGRNQVMLA
jgi:diguanylate cyclase (GGDEF)-like protein